MKQLELKVGKYSITVATQEKDGVGYVAVRPLCEMLGLDWSRQCEKLQSNPQFKCIHMSTVAGDGKDREMILLPAHQIGMWICTINARKVRVEVRGKLLSCQEYLQWVIHKALTGEITPEKFYALESTVQKMVGLLEQLVSENKLLREENSELQSQLHTSYNSDRMLASVGGKMLAASKKTKSIRQIH